MKIQYLVSLLFIFGTFSACNKDEQKADIPAYITINDVSVNAKVNEGSSSDNITDVKVFIDDQSLGTFQLPATVPIRQTGFRNLKIRPVIQVNGLSNSKKDYPFYTTFELDTTFIPEGRMTINPEVEYFSTAVFDNPWTGEDFETGINFEYSPASDTTFVRVTGDEAFEGASGLAYLTENQTFFEVWTPNLVDVPRNGGAIYMEFDYKSTFDIVVSFLANGQSFQSAIVYLKSQSEYQKMYIELSPIFSSYPTAINFNVAISMPKALGVPGSLYLDNAKLVRF